MRAIIMATLSLVSTAAMASSEASWTELDTVASRACMTNITKRYGPERSAAFGVLGHISGIGGANSDANYAVVIQRTARLSKDLWVCLYDKQTRTVSAGLVQMTPQ